MLEQKSFGLFLAAYILCASVAMAGDVASFADLGFSANGNYYMFGQYGVDEDSLKPWADLNIIDVASNDFVQKGRISYKHNEKIAVGQDGSGALLKVIADNNGLIAKYNTNFMENGIPLFISLQNGHNPQGDSIDFRDFEYENHYWADLVPAFFGSGKNIRSSFFIKLRKEGKNGAKNYRVGSPDVKRSGVTSYTIKRVIVNPQRTSMILVIEMTVLNGSGPDVRYMIEALPL
ncbi:hypothetical protein FACS1894190_05270 [Spirochaetia bacterium]|nr:hypothetical protein FACS1894190_05270 [Spirochaetia bacterium]